MNLQVVFMDLFHDVVVLACTHVIDGHALTMMAHLASSCHVGSWTLVNV